MPVPISDATNALRLHPERTEAALQKIESLLQRNHSPMKFASDQAYRLQQGFLISSTQQMVDRLVVQVQDTLNALNAGGSGSEFSSDMDAAESIVKDADNSKQLMPQLQCQAHSQGENNLVQDFLKQMAHNLKETVEKQIKRNTEEMLKCAKNQCGAILADKNFLSDLESGCNEKSTLPKNYTSIVLEDVATDIHNKLSEIDLAVAAYLSDKVVDEVIESLSKHHKTLTNHLNVTKTGQFKDNRKEEKTEKNESNAEKELRAKSDEKSKSPAPYYSLMDVFTSSPSLSRKKDTLHKRKYRPQSTIEIASHSDRDQSSMQETMNRRSLDKEQVQVVLSQRAASLDSASENHVKRAKARKFINGNLIESRNEITIKIDGPEDDMKLFEEPKKREPAVSLDEIDSVLELDNIQKLEHVTKSRPKRARAHAPTRPTPPRTSEMNGPVDQTADSFFGSTPVKKEHVAPSNEASSPSLQRHEDAPKSEKKKGWFSKDKKKEEKPASKPTSGGFSNRLPNFLRTRKSGDRKDLEVEDSRQVENKTPSPKLDKKSEDKKSPLIKEEEQNHTSPSAEKKRAPVASILEEEGIDLDSAKKSDDEAEDEVPKEIIPRKPVGVRMPGMGVGGNVLAEMKAKRLSHVPKQPDRESSINDNAPVVLPVHKLKPVPRTEESKKDDSKKEDVKRNNSEEVKPLKPVLKKDESVKEENKKEEEKLTSSIKERKSSGPENGHSHSEEPKPKAAPRSVQKPPTVSKRLSDVHTKPPPPTRPKPSLATKPKPGARNSLHEEKKTDEAEHNETSPKGKDTEVVYDSDTLRMSVKQKIKKMGLTDSEKDKKPESTSLPDLFENPKPATTPTSPPIKEETDEKDGSPSPRIITDRRSKDITELNSEIHSPPLKSPSTSEKKLSTSSTSSDRNSITSDDTKINRLSESEKKLESSKGDSLAEMDGGDENKRKSLSTSVKSASGDDDLNKNIEIEEEDSSINSAGGSNPEDVVYI